MAPGGYIEWQEVNNRSSHSPWLDSHWKLREALESAGFRGVQGSIQRAVADESELNLMVWHGRKPEEGDEEMGEEAR